MVLSMLTTPYTCDVFLMEVNSSGTPLENLPWLSWYAKKALVLGTGKARALESMGIARAKQRYARGSTTKDLFYYLVRSACFHMMDGPG